MHGVADKGYFPRAWGPPQAPIPRIRSWRPDSRNGDVLRYAARMIKDHLPRDVNIPWWFVQRLSGSNMDFRRKFNSLSYFRKLQVSMIRVQWYLFTEGKAPSWLQILCSSSSPRGWSVRFKNLAEVLRTSLHKIAACAGPLHMNWTFSCLSRYAAFSRLEATSQ